MALHARGQALDAMLSGTGLWNTTQEDFLKEHRAWGFHWLSAAKDVAETQWRGVTLFSGTVYQVDAAFHADKLSGVTVSIYNRGDAGDVTSDEWAALLKKTFAGMDALTGVKWVDEGKEASNAVNAQAVVWQTGVSRFLLEYSFTREIRARSVPFRGEFVRLSVSPPEKPKTFMETALASATPRTAAFDGPSHVRTDASGDVRLETVPMVDQGRKGYCVVATAERVLRYYGVPVDENELAELANSSATEGTSNAAMFDSLKKLSNRLQVRIRTISTMDGRQLTDLMNDYDRVARRKHEQELPDPGAVQSWSELYAAMKPEILKEARTRNKGEMSRFQQEVQDSINRGVPVLWSVMLGVIREPKDPSGVGGHMRLIIGYNNNTNEILYSDSWGPGHELKRMPVGDAWSMTMSMNSIEPIQD
jgi:hypothetical protein